MDALPAPPLPPRATSLIWSTNTWRLSPQGKAARVRWSSMADRVSTVWMVSARTGLEGRKGQLTLKDRALVFVPESDRYGDSVFMLVDIARVRRARGSPVLEIHLDL